MTTMTTALFVLSMIFLLCDLGIGSVKLFANWRSLSAKTSLAALACVSADAVIAMTLFVLYVNQR